MTALSNEAAETIRRLQEQLATLDAGISVLRARHDALSFELIGSGATLNWRERLLRWSQGRASKLAYRAEVADQLAKIGSVLGLQQVFRITLNQTINMVVSQELRQVDADFAGLCDVIKRLDDIQLESRCLSELLSRAYKDVSSLRWRRSRMAAESATESLANVISAMAKFSVATNAYLSAGPGDRGSSTTLFLARQDLSNYAANLWTLDLPSEARASDLLRLRPCLRSLLRSVRRVESAAHELLASSQDRYEDAIARTRKSVM